MKQIIIAIVIAVAVGIPTASAIGTYTISDPNLVGVFPTGQTEKFTAANGQATEYVYLVAVLNHGSQQQLDNSDGKVTVTDETGYTEDRDITDYEISLYELAGEPVNPQDKTEPEEEVIEYSEAYIDAQKEEDVSNLRQCLEEFATESPTRFESWARTSKLIEFHIPDGPPEYDNIDLSKYLEVRDPALAWQECEGMKNYPWLSVQYANKVIDTLEYYGLDPFDSPHTQDLEEADFERSKNNALRDFEVYGHEDLDVIYGEFTGTNRGNPEPIIPDWYAKYKPHATTDTQEAVEKAMVTVCVYVEQYRHKIGTDSFPQWLEHCVP